jgi:serine/threonine protein kinase
MEDNSVTTNKCDMWAFGCTLLHMLTGQPPWSGRNMGQIAVQASALLCRGMLATGVRDADAFTGTARMVIIMAAHFVCAFVLQAESGLRWRTRKSGRDHGPACIMLAC